MGGPDKGWAWAVAFAALILNLILAGLGRISGILYVSFIEMFELDRKGASVPFSVRSSMRNLLGPVVGILGQKYGVQKIIFVGAVIASASAACCFFVNDIFWLTFFWGGMGGAGAALAMCIVQVRVGQYFKAHRSTAAGMSFSGGCLGSLFFPVLIETLLREYQLQGTFLLMSGVILHCVPAAMILRKPPWLQKKDVEKVKQETKVITSSTEGLVKLEDGVILNNMNGVEGNDSKQYSSKDLESFPDIQFLQNHNNLVAKILTLNLDDNTNNKTIEKCPNQSFMENQIKETMEILYYKQKRPVSKHPFKTNLRQSKNNILSEILTKNDFQKICSHKSQCYVISKTNSVPDINTITNDIYINFVLLKMREVFKMDRNQVMARCFPEQSKEDVGKVLTELKKLYNLHVDASKIGRVEDAIAECTGNVDIVHRDMNSMCAHIRTAFRLFTNPHFVLTCLCRSAHFLSFVPVMTTIVDVAIDKGLTEEDGKYVIAVLSAGDLVGRAGLGWVTDRGYLTLPKFMLVFMVIQGVSCATLPLIRVQWAIYLSLGFFGMLQGSLFVRHTILVLKYMGNHEQSIAMGSINLFSGFLGFVLPLYIGYFRDTLGSYDYIFYINGGICTTIGLIWFFEPYFRKLHSSEEQPNA